MDTPRISIKPGKEKSLLNRHPWVFSGAVAEHAPLPDGTIVSVCLANGTQVGYAFYTPGNQLMLRLFAFSEAPLPVMSEGFWAEKLRQAQARRRMLGLPAAHTDAYRLVHAEGDGLPGLIVDVYGPVAVVQRLTQGIKRITPWLLAGLQQLGFELVFDRSKDSAQWLLGSLPTNEVNMRENGVSFLVDVAHGQKTGFFLDQREARKLLGQYSPGREVLNAFSYSGGFSMYALKAGAKRVHSVDISQAAVDLSVVNAQANGFDSPQHEGYCADVFEFLREMPAHAYDLIVLDPPAFAKHADAVKKAARGYKDINLKAMQKIRPGGLLFTFSCSQKIETELFRKIVFAAAADAGREARVLHATAQGPDHPTSIFHPEGEYLKGLVLQVD